MANAWKNRLYKANYPKIELEQYSREDDVTFSFGRETTYEEVLNLLSRSGCFRPEDYLSAIKMLRITRKTDNGQVFLTTAEKGVADMWANKINNFAKKDIRKCHTYTNKEVLVYMNTIHASVDVEKEVVEN